MFSPSQEHEILPLYIAKLWFDGELSRWVEIGDQLHQNREMNNPLQVRTNLLQKKGWRKCGKGRCQRPAECFGPTMNEFCLSILNLFVFLGNSERSCSRLPGKQPAKRKEGSSRCFTVVDQDWALREGSYVEYREQRKHSLVLNIFRALLFNFLRALY